MAALKAANLALKFLLELCALAAFAIFGASVGGGAASLLAAVVLPVVAVVLWGTLAAPRARRRLPLPARVPFELTFFGLAALALVAAGSTLGGVVLAAAVLVNSWLLTAFDQWEL